jgi:hypothetical protein
MFGVALAALIAAAPAPAPIPPGSYTYTATMNGATIGTSTLAVTSDGATTTIVERVSGSISGESASASNTLVLGPDLSPMRYQMNGLQDGSALKDAATFSATTANITDVHGKPSSVALPANAKHFAVSDFGLFSGLLALPAQMRAWGNAPLYVVVPELGRGAVLVPDMTAKPQRPTGVPAADEALVFSGDIPFTLWYDPSTNVPDYIDVSAQGITVTRQH